MAAELRAEGWAVNRKRIAQLMRDDNPLALARRSFVATSNAGHNFCVAMNLAGKMEVTGVDRLWVADLTYICLAEQSSERHKGLFHRVSRAGGPPREGGSWLDPP